MATLLICLLVAVPIVGLAVIVLILRRRRTKEIISFVFLLRARRKNAGVKRRRQLVRRPLCACGEIPDISFCRLRRIALEELRAEQGRSQQRARMLCYPFPGVASDTPDTAGEVAATGPGRCRV